MADHIPRILSITSGRADVSILLPVWVALAHRAELHVMYTGMHINDDGACIPQLPGTVTVHRGGSDIGGTSGDVAARAMADIICAVGSVCQKVDPDAVLVIGDRLDMLPAAVATVPFNIPLAHLHGGEITLGAIDDRLRHCISKLAHIHFVSSGAARSRLIAMGEEPDRIHVTGGPGIDTLVNAPALTRRSFLDAVGFDDIAETDFLRLVTVHPETNADDPVAPLEAILQVLDLRPGPTLLTAPNSDPGGTRMLSRMSAFVAERPWSRLVMTLGPELYPNAMRHADVMLGNSSSGVIEAGIFGLPVIDVGHRQRGREFGGNVVKARADAGEILTMLDAIAAERRRFESYSPYGDGQSGPRIAEHLVKLPPRRKLLDKISVPETCPGDNREKRVEMKLNPSAIG
jgi:UDP-hydrolysing UDP-N-acetyl-D-glucosamine 2-epimerase